MLKIIEAPPKNGWIFWNAKDGHNFSVSNSLAKAVVSAIWEGLKKLKPTLRGVWRTCGTTNGVKISASKIGGRNLEAIQVYQGGCSFGVDYEPWHTLQFKTIPFLWRKWSKIQIVHESFQTCGFRRFFCWRRTRSPSATSFKGPASPAVAPTRQGKWSLGCVGVHGR